MLKIYSINIVDDGPRGKTRSSKGCIQKRKSHGIRGFQVFFYRPIFLLFTPHNQLNIIGIGNWIIDIGKQ